MHKALEHLSEKIIKGEPLNEEKAAEIANLQGSDIFQLFVEANRVKEHFFGSKVHLCSIINAKSGRCPENCSFCAQSSHHSANISEYPLVTTHEILEMAIEAEKTGSKCFGIVTSGTSISNEEELERICTALKKIREKTGIAPACSLGIIDYNTAKRLKKAGAITYHHNLETSESFFPQICTTHDYQQDIETIRNAKKSGMTVCSGGIFGLGESVNQRIEMAITLRELDVDSIPINFLNPIEGTPLVNAKKITPMACLVTIAIYRLILPDKKIIICGGREKNLCDLQSWIFFAGATGMMIGDYLTTSGRNVDSDIQMLEDLGLLM